MARAEKFVNRVREIEQLDGLSRHQGLIVAFGRRRVGKTTLLTEWLRGRGGRYSQAVEGSVTLQLAQTFLDLKDGLDVAIEPKSWPDLFTLLDSQRKRLILCLDEFPYLVAAEPALPSMLQKWLDHRKKKDVLLIVAGSSTRMMHSTFLDGNAPLYGRALATLRLEPMGFRHFCDFFGGRKRDQRSFALYALTGGVPKYWQWLGVAANRKRKDPVALAERLFFRAAGWMEEEPRRVLADERLSGIPAVSVLEAIGRGAHRPSEIAARMGVPQTSLSKLFQALLDASLITRDIPFGVSERDPKRTLYRIGDPALRFWFSVYSPHRARWHSYDRGQRSNLVAQHSGAVFEDWVRSVHLGSRRYWDATVELDMVREERHRGSARLVVSEVKWKAASASQRKLVESKLMARFQKSGLARQHRSVRFEVIDATDIMRLAAEEA